MNIDNNLNVTIHQIIGKFFDHVLNVNNTRRCQTDQTFQPININANYLLVYNTTKYFHQFNILIEK